MNNRKVLIVDDFPSIIDSVKLMLEDIEGLVFETAISGIEAYSKIKESAPELIILDVEMPGGNGDELLAKMKQEDSLKNIKVLGFTASYTSGKYLKQLGADKVIIKTSKESEPRYFQKTVEKLLEA